MKHVRAVDGRFVDEQGRHVILHGISMVCKEKEMNYIGDWSEKDFIKLQEWGFNVIRLGIIWDGIEPEPGRYDDRYLERVREMIKLAYEHGIYVFLDMHQDLYSSLYADGAPEWATLTGGHTYEKTDLWSDAYLFSGAVQSAFDHFWSNAPAPDGIGLQDHYVAAWKHAVQQLRNEPNLIGYDIMNEPFIGSDVLGIVHAMFAAFADLAAEQSEGPAPGVEELMTIWMDPEKKLEALQMLNSAEAYRKVMETTAVAQAHFEQNILSAFYQKARDAIREVDPHRLLFLETNYFSNMGVPSAIMPATDAEGKPDAQQAYAPHGYDLVTDSDYVHAASGERVDVIFNQHEATRERLGMPMMIGEWGAYGESDLAEEASLHVQKRFEELLASDVYWSYLYPEMDRYSSFKGVCRGYPMAASGSILRYSYDHEKAGFEMEWEEDGSNESPTLVYLPNLKAENLRSIELSPSGSSFEWTELNDAGAGVLRIATAGGGKRYIRI
ncbi:cellulase family glycosylhydrolase [Paenibacillus sp. LHD-117]|uniref:cellulase family glycosylhydrolase n=1 Tax=Paenibacillus sp. LHD-117 TaxID=3071412 RepID=UPI0027E07292|nr:cellulase family glycosylhydrolase [Paenibacillus sp. LHD-117]MDQ6420546.1 cellulase family glycosylhydrolase [Paenibacillus sp. LHD-117]